MGNSTEAATNQQKGVARAQRPRQNNVQGSGITGWGTSIDNNLVQRASLDAGALNPTDILALQRTIGNQHVATLLQSSHPDTSPMIQRTPIRDLAQPLAPPAQPRPAKSIIQRNPVNSLRQIGRTRVYKGQAGGVGSQQKAFETINMSLEARAARLNQILNSTYSSSKSRFEDVRMALTGGGDIAKAYQTASGGGDLRNRITYLFGRYPLRLQYLLEMLDHGEPAQYLQLAEKTGALDSMMKSGRTIVDMATRDNVMAYVQSMSYEQLQLAYEKFPGQLKRAAGFRGMQVITARLKRQALEDEMGKKGHTQTGTPTSEEEGANQTRLLQLYDNEAAQMVRLRRSKLMTSRGWNKIKGRKGGLKKSRSTDTKRIVQELRSWALDKDPAVIEKLTHYEGKLHQELRWAFGLSFSTALSTDSVKYVYEMMRYPDSYNPEHAVKQIEAVLNRRIGSHKLIRKFKKGATAEIEEILDQVDPEDFQRVVGRDRIEKIEQMSDDAHMDYFWKAILKSNPHKRRITHRMRHGKKAKGGSVYDQIWQICDSKVKQADFLRVSQRLVNIIQKDLDHSTAEFQMVRNDGDLLRRIKAITTRLPGTRDSWTLITKILGVPEDVDGMPKQEEFKFASQYKDEAKTHWKGLDLADQAAHWAARIDAELNSVISRPSTVLMHIYNAQKDADLYASDATKDPSKQPDEKYKEFMQSVGKAITHKFGFFRFRNSFWDPRRRGPTIKRIKGALSGDPAKRLTLGDILDATKGSFGKARTDSAQVENVVKLLSGKEMLDEWTNFAQLEAEANRIKGLPTSNQDEQQTQAAEKQKFANSFLLVVRPEFWDQKLEKHGMGAFGEVEKGHVTFRDLLRRSKRVDIERKLLNRIADKAEGVDEFQALAGWLAGVENEPSGPEMAAKYFANRTKAVALMEGAQLLSSGAQWSYFSTASTEYKGSQAQLAGTTRQHLELDSQKSNSQQRMQTLSKNVEEFDTRSRRLSAEEQHFRDIQKTYNGRVKAIVGTIGAIITTAIAAGIAGATWGAGAPILFTALTASLITVLGTLATTLVKSGAKYFAQGHAYSHMDTARDAILTTIQSLFKAGLTVGVRAFTGGVEDILGVLATHILAQLIRQLGMAATKDVRNAIERWFETSNFADFAARMQDEVIDDLIEDLQKISKKVGVKGAIASFDEAKMIAMGEERPEQTTTSWGRFTKGDPSKQTSNSFQDRAQYGLEQAKKRGQKKAKRKKGPLIASLTEYVGTEHDMYISRPENDGTGQKGATPRHDLEVIAENMIDDEIAQESDANRRLDLFNLQQDIPNDDVFEGRLKNLSKEGFKVEVKKWIEERVPKV